MREKMSEMQRQIEALRLQLKYGKMSQRTRSGASTSQPGNSLIPVIQVRRPKKTGF